MILLALVVMGLPRIGLADDKPFGKKGQLGVAAWVDFSIPGSLTSFEKHANQIDQVYILSYSSSQQDGMPHPMDIATADLKARVIAAAKRNNVVTWMLADNYSNVTAQYEPKIIEKLIHNGDMKKQHIKTLVDYALRDGVNGIQVDYRGVEDFTKGIRNRGDLKNFMVDLKQACKTAGLYCSVRVPHKEYRDGNDNFEDATDYPGISGSVDQIVPVNEDQNRGLKAPFSAPEWLDVGMAYATSVMNPSKLLASYRNEGYDWVTHGKTTMLTHQDFLDLAQKYHVTPVRDNNYSQELSIEYNDEKGVEHKAWISDNRTLELNCDVAKKYHLYGIAIYRLGAEDESFWETLKKVTASPNTTANLLPPEPAPPVAAKLRPIPLFTDDMGNTSAYAYPEPDTHEARHGGAHFLVIYKQGKRWWDLNCEGDQWSGGGLSFPVCDLTNYRAHGALTFFVRGFHGGEVFDVGFSGPKGLKDRLAQWGFTTSTKIADYVKITTAWQQVTIPLEDFKNTGQTWSDRQGQQIYNLFRWNRVSSFTIDIDPPTSDPDFHLQFAEIQVIPTYDVKAVAKEKESMQ